MIPVKDRIRTIETQKKDQSSSFVNKNLSQNKNPTVKISYNDPRLNIDQQPIKVGNTKMIWQQIGEKRRIQKQNEPHLILPKMYQLKRNVNLNNLDKKLVDVLRNNQYKISYQELQQHMSEIDIQKNFQMNTSVQRRQSTNNSLSNLINNISEYRQKSIAQSIKNNQNKPLQKSAQQIPIYQILNSNIPPSNNIKSQGPQTNQLSVTHDLTVNQDPNNNFNILCKLMATELRKQSRQSKYMQIRQSQRDTIIVPNKEDVQITQKFHHKISDIVGEDQKKYMIKKQSSSQRDQIQDRCQQLIGILFERPSSQNKKEIKILPVIFVKTIATILRINLAGNIKQLDNSQIIILKKELNA